MVLGRFAERHHGRRGGAPLVAVLAGAVIALLLGAWLYFDSPGASRRRAAAECRAAYETASASADTLRIDATVAIPRAARSATRNETCGELRARGEL